MTWNLNQLRGVVLVAVLAAVAPQTAMARHGNNGGGNNSNRFFSAKSSTQKLSHSTPMMQTAPLVKTAPVKRWQVFNSGKQNLNVLNAQNTSKKFLQQSNTANLLGRKKFGVLTPMTPGGPLVGTTGPKGPLGPLVVDPLKPTSPIGPFKPPIGPIGPIVVDPVKPPLGPFKPPIGPIGPIVVDPVKPPLGPFKPPIGPIGPIVVDPVKPPIGPIGPWKPPIGPIGPIVVDPVTPPTTPPTPPPCPPQDNCPPKGGCFPGIGFPIFGGGFGGNYCGNYGGGYGGTTVVVADATAPVTQSSGMVDLVLEDIRLVQPATVVAGPAYQVKFRNQGTRAVGAFNLGLYAALDGKAIEGAQAVVQVPGLAAGEVGEMILRLPASSVQLTSTSGQSTMFSHLAVAVDPDNLVVESNKTNNGAVVARTALEAQQQ